VEKILGQRSKMVMNGWYGEECKEILEEQSKA